MRTVTAGAVATAGLLAVSPQPAQAGTNWGVDSLHAEPVALTCQPGQALPCVPGSGTGASGVLQVTQSDAGGEMRFDALQGTSAVGDDHVWFGVEVGAECKGIYDLSYFTFSPERGNADWKYDTGPFAPPPQEVSGVPDPDYWWQGVSVPDAAHMPDKTVVLDIAIEDVLGFYDGVPTSPYWFGETSVFDQGEAEVAERVAAGMSETQARSTAFHVDTTVLVSATVGCEKSGGDTWNRRVERELPLRVEFLPAPHQGVKDQTPTRDLAVPVEVTDVELDVSVDPQDSCRLDLVGTIETTGATQVRYRWVNPYGQPSNTYTTSIGSNRTGTVDTHVAIPGHDGADPTGDLVTEEPQGDLDEEWAPAPTDGSTWAGTYTLQVLAPTAATDIAGFRVDRCVDVGTVGDGAVGELADHRDPTHGGTAPLAEHAPQPAPTATRAPATGAHRIGG